MQRVSVASVLVFTFLVACSADPAQDALVASVRKMPGHIRIGDVPIHQGRISWHDEVFQFRACDRVKLYFVDAPFSIHDTLDLTIQSAVNPSAIYVRFYGEVIAGVDGLPDRYADAVRITELLSYSDSVPVVCN